MRVRLTSSLYFVIVLFAWHDEWTRGQGTRKQGKRIEDKTKGIKRMASVGCDDWHRAESLKTLKQFRLLASACDRWYTTHQGSVITSPDASRGPMTRGGRRENLQKLGSLVPSVEDKQRGFFLRRSWRYNFSFLTRDLFTLAYLTSTAGKRFEAVLFAPLLSINVYDC